VKKFFLFLLTIFTAYLTAFYTESKKNGYTDLFPVDSLFNNDRTEDASNLEKGISYLNTEDYDAALEYFFDKLDEGNQKANYYIGYTYNKKGDFETALIYLNETINTEPKNPEAWLQKGIAEYNLTNYTDAVNDLYFSTELNSENPTAYYYLAETYNKTGKSIVALQAAETALEYDSLNTDYRFEAASIAYDAENYERAVFHYKKYLESFKDDKYTMMNIGLCYNKLSNKDSAVYWYNKVIEKYPDYSLAYNNKGWIYQTEGNYEKAISYYDKAIKYDSVNTYPLWNRADSYFEIGKYEKALADYKKVYTINDSYYNTLYHTALCYEKIGDFKNAAEYFQLFLNLSSNDNKYYTKAQDKIKKLKKQLK